MQIAEVTAAAFEIIGTTKSNFGLTFPVCYSRFIRISYWLRIPLHTSPRLFLQFIALYLDFILPHLLTFLNILSIKCHLLSLLAPLRLTHSIIRWRSQWQPATPTAHNLIGIGLSSPPENLTTLMVVVSDNVGFSIFF